MDRESPSTLQDQTKSNLKTMNVNLVPPKMVGTSTSVSSSSGPSVIPTIPSSSSSSTSLNPSQTNTFIKNHLNNSSSWKTEPKKFLSHVRYEHLVAGMSGGVASTLILHPLDLVKIRFAVSDGHHSRPKYDGLYHAFRSILKDEGVPGLYRGVTPNVWGAGFSWGLYFLFYSTLKQWMQGGDTRRDLGAAKHMTIAAEAGLLTLIVTNPLWVVKTRLCLQYGSPSAAGAIATTEGGIATIYYSGMTDALRKVWQFEGIRGLYKGFVPGMFGVSHGAIQFMTYEEMKTVYNRYRELPIDTKLSTGEYLSFAAVSKLIAAGTTYPYQVVRARLQDQHRSYTGVMDVLRQTWSKEGFFGFYKGLVPNLIRVVPATAITFVVYEKTSAYLIARKDSSSSSKPNCTSGSTNENSEGEK